MRGDGYSSWGKGGNEWEKEGARLCRGPQTNYSRSRGEKDSSNVAGLEVLPNHLKDIK